MASRRRTPGQARTAGTGLAALFEQYRGKLQRFVLERTAHKASAKDLSQEVYLRLLRFPPQELIREPQAYLYRVASNVVHDFNLRMKETCVTFDSEVADELSDSAANAWRDDPAARLSAEEELERLLAEMPAPHRVALLLAKRDGLSYEDIAAQMGVSVHAVKKYVVRALAHCRAAARARETGAKE